MKTHFAYIITGILIAVISPAILKIIFPESKLEYHIEGPIEVGRNSSLKVMVENKGEKPQKNVRLSFDKSIYSDDKELGSSIIIAPDTLKARSENGKIVILLGDLRPNEKQSIGIASSALDINKYGLDDEVRGVTVKSDDYLADQVYDTELEKVAYPVCFWIVVLSLISIILFGIYYDFFVSFEKKEEALIKQLESLRKKNNKPHTP